MASEKYSGPARPGGFTLVEVMVAVSIVAIGLTGILTTINGMANSSAYLRDKTLANWVAQNHIVALRLDSDWPEIGKSTDDIEMAGQEWRVAAEVSATPVEKLRRIDVSVSYSDTPDDPLVVIAAFVGEPGAAAPVAGWREGARLNSNRPGTNRDPDEDNESTDREP